MAACENVTRTVACPGPDAHTWRPISKPWLTIHPRPIFSCGQRRGRPLLRPPPRTTSPASLSACAARSPRPPAVPSRPPPVPFTRCALGSPSDYSVSCSGLFRPYVRQGPSVRSLPPTMHTTTHTASVPFTRPPLSSRIPAYPALLLTAFLSAASLASTIRHSGTEASTHLLRSNSERTRYRVQRKSHQKSDEESSGSTSTESFLREGPSYADVHARPHSDGSRASSARLGTTTCRRRTLRLTNSVTFKLLFGPF